MGARLRDIQRRIRSVESTKKITKAMELISASRIIRAERRVKESRPYAEKISQVIRDLAATTEKLEHPLLETKDEGADAVVVITADRGLAGAYNANALRLAERTRRATPGAAVYALGRKGASAFRFRRIAIQAQWSGFSDRPSYDDAREVATKLIEDFSAGVIRSANLVYTVFESLMTQRPATLQILPVRREELEGGREFSPLFEFEPEPSELLVELLPSYVEMQVYQALLESAASEHAARRRAMSSATDNAEDLISHLTRVMNQARQAEITSEIADIVGGAEALLAKAEAGLE
ncbi:MAG: F0F1 ATP synthase subunit gamma [Actinomycetota bacterium]